MRFRNPLIALTLTTTLPVFAQEAPPLAPLSIEVVRVDKIPNVDVDVASPCCAPEVMESGAETDFIYLDIDFDVAWSDEVERVRLSGRDAIFLQLPGQTMPEERIKAWGRVRWYPEVEGLAPSIEKTRPRGWPDVDEDARLNAVFTIPQDATAALLILGKPDEPQLEIPIDLSVPASDWPSSASFFDVVVDDFAVVPDIMTSKDLVNATVAGVIRATEGQLLALTLTITPKQNLNVDPSPNANSAAFNTRSFMLVGPEGHLLMPMGQDRRGHVGNNIPNTTNWSGEGTTGAMDNTFYFLGSGMPGDYRIFMNEDEVATATLN